MQTVRKIIAGVLVLITGFSNAAPLAYASVDTKQTVVISDTNGILIDPVDPPPLAEQPKKKNSIDTSSMLTLNTITSARDTAHPRLPVTVRKMPKEDFKPSEDIQIIVNNPDDEQFETKIEDANGDEVGVELTKVDTGSTTEIILEPTNQFKPGKFTVTITDAQGQTTKQDFTWGVLAFNTDKATYKPNETAQIHIGVLDDVGDMVCDASVELRITAPSSDGLPGQTTILSTDNKKVMINQQCQSHDFSLKPDYETTYTIGQPGDYGVTMNVVTKNGVRSMTDTIRVREHEPFSITRTTATRIYPPNAYPVHLDITAEQDFSGTITETVPESFTITPTDQDETKNPIGNSYDNMKTVYQDDRKNPEIHLESSVLGASTSALVMPFEGSFQISQGFGSELTDLSLRNFYAHYGLGGHDGIDFALPMGTPLYAVDEGNVLLAGDGDYGTTVVIQHSWGRSYYGHLSKVTASGNTSVTKGSLIGYSGNTGESTGPHLHFGLKPNNPDTNNGYAGKVNPLLYLPLSTASQEAPKPEALVENTQVLGVQTSQAAEASSSATPVTQDFTVADKIISQEAAADTNTSTEKVKVITWNVNLKKGEKTTLTYYFKAPLISPQFYTVGPAKFFEQEAKQPLYQETRAWQIAADEVGVDWYNKSWQYRKEITIDQTKVNGSGTLSNFPVLVNLTSDTNLAGKAQTDADDIVFTSSNGRTKLSHEIESYTSGTGALIAWVKVLSVSATTDTDIYMYYGNPAASNQQDATNVWDTNYTSVWHLNEVGDGSGYDDFLDSTSTNNDARGGGADPAQTPARVTGKIGFGQDFDGSNDYIEPSVDGIISGVNAYTIEAWIEPDDCGDTGGSGVIFKQFGDNSIEFTLCGSGTGNLMLWQSSGNEADSANGVVSTSSAPWQHVAAVYNGSGTVAMYVNGAAVSMTDSSITEQASVGSQIIGVGSSGSSTDNFDGAIDEVRASNTNRSADWIGTEYNNQNSPSTFYALGSEETYQFAASNSQLMRGGKFFDSSGSKQPFVF